MGQWANLDVAGRIDAGEFRRGALNLLLDCAGAKPGESLLILAEDPELGFYGPGLAEAVAEEARTLGLDVDLRMIGFSPDADELPPDLVPAVEAADHTLFLARLGDQLRFRAMPAGSRPIVSYALDRETFASPFAAAPYGAFVALKKAFDQLFAMGDRSESPARWARMSKATSRRPKPPPRRLRNRPMSRSSASPCRSSRRSTPKASAAASRSRICSAARARATTRPSA